MQRSVNTETKSDYTIYYQAGLRKKVLCKPTYPQVGPWLITGVLVRSDSSDTCLAEHVKSHRSAIITYLVPGGEIEYMTPKHESFIEIGQELRRRKKRGIRFVPEGKVRRAGTRLEGVRSSYDEGHNTVRWFCANPECGSEISQRILESIPFEQGCRCQCGQQIQVKYSSIVVPVILGKYKNPTTLKRALVSAAKDGLVIPNLVFCHLIYRTACILINNRKLPVLPSSNAILLNNDGSIDFTYTPTTAAPKFVFADMPGLLARFFGAFLAHVPDVSAELSRFIAIPNPRSLKPLGEFSKQTTRRHMVDWLAYVQKSTTAGAMNDEEIYLPVQAMIVDQCLRKQHKIEELITPTDPTVHPQCVTLRDIGVIAEAEKRLKGRQQEQAARKESWRKHLDPEPQAPRGLLDAVLLLFKKIPMPQKLLYAASIAIVVLCSAALTIADLGKDSAAGTSQMAAVLKASPATIIRNTVPAELSRSLGNSAATARVLVNDFGTIQRVQWIYATQEQQAAYRTLQFVKFEPATQNGQPKMSWHTLQLPLR